MNHVIQATEKISITGASPVIVPELANIDYIDEPVCVDTVSRYITKSDPQEVQQEVS